MLGFLGLTADVTGFEFDHGVLMFSLLCGIVAQIFIDAEPNNDNTGKDLLKQRQLKKK